MIKKLIIFAFIALAIATAIPSSRAKLQQDVYKPILDNVRSRLVPSRLNAASGPTISISSR